MILLSKSTNDVRIPCFLSAFSFTCLLPVMSFTISIPVTIFPDRSFNGDEVISTLLKIDQLVPNVKQIHYCSSIFFSKSIKPQCIRAHGLPIEIESHGVILFPQETERRQPLKLSFPVLFFPLSSPAPSVFSSENSKIKDLTLNLKASLNNR
jgi:hypothetical protein